MFLLDNVTYLNHASIGPIPKTTYDIVQNGYLEQAQIGERKIDYDKIDTLWESITSNAAKLINGKKEGVAITNNTAMGLHIVADGLFPYFERFRGQKGANIVIPEIEFVTNSYVWQQLAKRYCFEFRTVPLTNGRLTNEAFEKLIDDKTILVALSYVQFSNGFRADIRHITSLAHEHGAYVVVDAIQGLGAVPFDVTNSDVDFVAAAGYKWLLGPLGTGIFYGKPELIETMDPLLVGWFSSTNFSELMHHSFTPFADARKFQQSMIGPLINGLDASLKVVLDWEVGTSFQKIIKLQDKIVKRVSEDEIFKVNSSLKHEERSGILNLTFHPDSKLNDIKTLVRLLGERNILVAYRDGLRVSPHAYNTTEEIDFFLDEIYSMI